MDPKSDQPGREISDKSYLNAGVNFYATLYNFGVFNTQVSQAKDYKKSLNETESQIEKEILYSVNFIYYSLLKLNFAIESLNRTRQSLNSHLKIVNNFLQEGMVDKNDLLQTELNLAAIEQNLITVEYDYKTLKRKLFTILDAEYPENAVFSDNGLLKSKNFEPEKIIEQAIELRPELKNLNIYIEILELQIKEIKRSYFPEIYTTGGYTYTGDKYRGPKDNYRFDLGIKMDIFDGNIKKAKLERIDKNLEIAKINLKDLKAQIKSEAYEAYYDFCEKSKKIEVSQKSVSQAEENLRLINNKYSERIVSSSDVLDAEALLSKARADYTNSLCDRKIAEAKLLKVSGNGNELEN